MHGRSNLSRRRGILMSAALFGLLIVASARGQVMQGDWVDASQKAIDKHRKTPLRVIVLDRDGRPAGLPTVRIEQKRHAFVWGVPIGALPPAASGKRDAAVWRCFSGVSLEAMTGYGEDSPTGGVQVDAVRRAANQAMDEGYGVRWGAVLSADAGRWPAQVAKLGDKELAEALSRRVHGAMTSARGVRVFDFYADSLDHREVESRLGDAGLRRLFEQAKATSPDVSLSLHFRESLEGERLRDMIRRVVAMQEVFVPVDGLSIDAKFRGTVLQPTLTRSLDWLSGMKLPIALVGVEVGGPTPAAAALNMETVLRLFFADPAFQGFWFAGATAEQCTDASAALIDTDGKPTPAGEILDKFVHGLWRTDVTIKGDELGNARVRVFAGKYNISAVLADGTTAETTAWLPANQPERIVVLQPIGRTHEGAAKP